MNVAAMWNVIQPSMAKHTQELRTSMFDTLDAGKATQMFVTEKLRNHGAPNLMPFEMTKRRPQTGLVEVDTLDLLARYVDAWGDVGHGECAELRVAQRTRNDGSTSVAARVQQGLQMTVLAGGAAMLPLGIIGWRAGLAASGSVFYPAASG